MRTCAAVRLLSTATETMIAPAPMPPAPATSIWPTRVKWSAAVSSPPTEPLAPSITAVVVPRCTSTLTWSAPAPIAPAPAISNEVSDCLLTAPAAAVPLTFSAYCLPSAELFIEASTSRFVLRTLTRPAPAPVLAPAPAMNTPDVLLKSEACTLRSLLLLRSLSIVCAAVLPVRMSILTPPAPAAVPAPAPVSAASVSTCVELASMTRPEYVLALRCLRSVLLSNRPWNALSYTASLLGIDLAKSSAFCSSFASTLE